MNKKQLFIDILVSLVALLAQYAFIFIGFRGLITGNILVLILGLVGRFGIILIVGILGKKHPDWFELWFAFQK